MYFKWILCDWIYLFCTLFHCAWLWGTVEQTERMFVHLTLYFCIWHCISVATNNVDHRNDLPFATIRNLNMNSHWCSLLKKALCFFISLLCFPTPWRPLQLWNPNFTKRTKIVMATASLISRSCAVHGVTSTFVNKCVTSFTLCIWYQQKSNTNCFLRYFHQLTRSGAPGLWTWSCELPLQGKGRSPFSP